MGDTLPRMSTGPTWLLPIGLQLREARVAKGRTQEWVALEADIDRSYLSQLENDAKSPTVDLLARVCRVLGVAVSELIAAAEEGKGR